MDNHMKLNIGFLFSLSLACFTAPAFAAFEDHYGSARTAALGGAFTALSDDAAAIHYNSAGLPKLLHKQAQFTYGRLMTGLDGVKLSLSQFAYAQSFARFLGAGIGWVNFTSDDLYREDAVVAGFGANLNQWTEIFVDELAVGVSVKYLSRKFVLDERTQNDPVFRDGEKKQAATFDLHLLCVPEAKLLPGLALGISVRSINEPVIGFDNGERLPREIVGGLNYSYNNFSFPFDVSYRSGSITPHLASEILLLNDQVAVRLGSDIRQFSSGLGYHYPFSDSLSVGLDYAFLWPLSIEGTSGTHRATIEIRF